MNTVKLRFYNAVRAAKFGKKLSPIDNLILLRSYPHTHVEIQYSRCYNNISFSATMQDNANACRFRDIDYGANSERWDTIFLPVTSQQEEAGFARAKELEGKPYDLIGLLSFASRLDIVKPNQNSYWCSEAVAEIILAMLGFDDFRPDSFSPSGLFFEMFWRTAMMHGNLFLE